jgi:PadR family transcriptional regulator, regulatory protein PadR
MTDIQQLRKGSTPILILSVLAQGKQHGYAIMRELELRSEGYFSMTAALLYPALHQMEQAGLVTSDWEQSSGQHKRKVYAITPSGRQRLSRGQAEWRQFVDRLFKTMGGQANLHMGDPQ